MTYKTFCLASTRIELATSYHQKTVLIVLYRKAVCGSEKIQRIKRTPPPSKSDANFSLSPFESHFVSCKCPKKVTLQIVAIFELERTKATTFRLNFFSIAIFQLHDKPGHYLEGQATWSIAQPSGDTAGCVVITTINEKAFEVPFLTAVWRFFIDVGTAQ